MADSTIHALTDGTTPASTDEFYVTRSPFSAGSDRKLTWTEILAATRPIAAGDLAAGAAASNLGAAGGDLSGTFPNPAVTPGANIAMSAHKLTGLAAGTANGDSVRYEQSPAGILTTKGDIVSATAANTPSRLGVGADTTVLTADSTAATGLKWAAVPGGNVGTVTSVASGDSSLVITNPSTTPSIQIATADVLFTNRPPAASVPMNTKKLTGLAAGSGAGDSVRYEQSAAGIMTAKGDLVGATAANTPARLAVGTDAQVLTADSTAATGLKWATAAGGGSGTVTSVASGDSTLVVTNATTTPSIQIATADVLFTNRPPAANLAMNAKKLTGLAAGTTAGDSVRFEQLPIGYVNVFDIVSTSSLATIISQSIPGNTLGSTGAIRVLIEGDYLNNSGATKTLILKVSFGGTAVWGSVTPTIAASASRRPFFMELLLANESTTNAQRMSGRASLGVTGAGSVAGVGVFGNEDLAGGGNAVVFTGSGVIDTTSAATLLVEAQHSGSASTIELRGSAHAQILT